MNYFVQALKNYAVFDGRARRKEFWYFRLFYFLTIMFSAFIGGIIGVPALPALVYFGFIIPLIAVGVRRMHDVGKSGWFIIIPFYNIILCFTEGDRGENDYGSDPKEEF